MQNHRTGSRGTADLSRRRSFTAMTAKLRARSNRMRMASSNNCHVDSSRNNTLSPPVDVTPGIVENELRAAVAVDENPPQVWTERRFVDTGLSLPGICAEDAKALRCKAGTFYSVHQLFGMQSMQLSTSYRRCGVSKKVSATSSRDGARECCSETFSSVDTNPPTGLPVCRKLSLCNSSSSKSLKSVADVKNRPSSCFVSPPAATASTRRGPRIPALQETYLQALIQARRPASLPMITVDSSSSENEKTR
eukprot:gene10836-11988_t